LIPRILKNALFEILNVRHWGVFWPAIAAVFIAVKPAPMIRRLLSAVAVTVACYLGAYLLTTWDVSFQMSVSFARLLLHVTPLLVLLAARQLAGAEKPDAP
jgi:succinate-acetate transporter protein